MTRYNIAIPSVIAPNETRAIISMEADYFEVDNGYLYLYNYTKLQKELIASFSPGNWCHIKNC